MKCFWIVALCCGFLLGCRKEAKAPSAISSIGHEPHLLCNHTHQVSSKESCVEKDSCFDWSEEKLKEQIELAKGGKIGSARSLYDYYREKEDLEEAKYWLIKTCEQIEALPSDHRAKLLLPNFARMLDNLEKKISFYKMSEEELSEYIKLAESGNINRALDLYRYYKHHHQFDRAGSWLEKIRDLAEQKVPAEEARTNLLAQLDAMQDDLLKEAAAK